MENFELLFFAYDFLHRNGKKGIEALWMKNKESFAVMQFHLIRSMCSQSLGSRLEGG